MKKSLMLLGLAIIGLSSFGQGASLDDAVLYLHEKGLTTFSNTKDYKPNNLLRRDEATKFFVNLAKAQGKTDYIKTDAECQFNDLRDGHADLQLLVVESCKLGLFKGHQGKFMPTLSLTHSQALAVLLRIISGYENEVGVNHWADNYYKKANELGLLNGLSVFNKKEELATRGNVALLIYNYGTDNRDFRKYENSDVGYAIDFPQLYSYEEIYNTDERISPMYCRLIRLYDNKGSELNIGIKKVSEKNIDISCVSGIPAGDLSSQNWASQYGTIKLTTINSNDEVIYLTESISTFEGYEISIYGVTPKSNNQSDIFKDIVSSLSLYN